MDRKRPRSEAMMSPKQALETLYHSLGGEAWTRKDNWLSQEQDISQWSGVTCNSIHGEVKITALELSQNNLQGTLDDKEVLEAFAALASTLEQLWLSENKLSGNLPAALAYKEKFPKLSILDLGSNKLRGSLHPAFARATQFSWLEYSGNELTSYFRYSNNTENVTTVIENIATKDIRSPLESVHVVPSLLSEEACQSLVKLALEYANQNDRGWQLDRHKDYKTTDLDVAVVGGKLLRLCNNILKDAILPALSKLFQFPVQDLAMEDLFLAKYSADKGQQRSLAQHRDGSELSFVVTLNANFQGGGTKFISDNITVAPKTAGTGVLFCGRLLHAGVEVVDGTRYILAGFVRVYPSTPDSFVNLQKLISR